MNLDNEWEHLLAEKTYEEVMDIYAPVFEVQQETAAELDKEKCGKQYAALKSGVAKLPMSAALNYWTYRCAEKVGTEQEAEKYFQLFSQVAKYAFSKASDQAFAKPIRIINQADIFALIAASGLVVVEQYIDTSDIGRYMPWVVVLWDEKDQRERSYSFDMLEFVSMASDKKLGSIRAVRMGTARGLIRVYAKAEWEPAQDALAWLESLSVKGVQQQIDVLRPFALRNARTSATTMFVHCINSKSQSCGQTLVDGMLDALEAKQSSAMVRIAALYSAGMGVKQNAEASINLLKAAEKRTGNKGLALHDFMYLQFDKDQINAMPASVMTYLENESFASNKGKAAPAFVYMQIRKLGYEVALPKYGAKLEPIALAGVEDSYELFALYQASKENEQQYRHWAELAARAGSAFSQRFYSEILKESEDPAKRAGAFGWMLESARNGNLNAINQVADEYYYQQSWEVAAVWYESASDQGDIDASMQLAALYARAPIGTEYTEKDAIDIYQALSKEVDSAKARRQWALLLMFGKTTPHDLVKARQLIQSDVDKDDPDSMIMLGEALYFGDIGTVDEKAGMALLDKVEATGNTDAADKIASILYFKKADEASLMRAKSLWLKAAEMKYVPAINNLGWTLCTSSHPGYWDPKTGLAVFKQTDTEQLPPSYRDSYAACLAATGDFEAAISNQKAVIEEMKRRGLEKDSSMSEMQSRLKLYQKNQVYIEPAKNIKP